MKNTVLYIIGGVVLIGGGAFLYMKYKKKPQGDLATQSGTTDATTTGATTTGATTTGATTTGATTTGATTTGATTTGATTTGATTTGASSTDKNLAEATIIAKQIDSINTKINNLKQRVLNTTNLVFKRQIGIQIDKENKNLVPLVEKIKDLGYTESYGLPVKIR
jgi:LPXTG-motif cell wall-anchored protein